VQGQAPVSQSLRTLPASPSTPSPSPLSEREVQAVLCVRAVEEVDDEGLLLARPERTRATERTREAETPEAFFARRAGDLVGALDRAAPGLGRLRRASGLRLATAWILVPAFLLGAATNLLGADQRINVLANALAGLLLWNLAVYLLILLAVLRRGRAPAPEERHATPLPELASRLLTWPARALLRGRAGADRRELVVRAAAAYLASWNRCARTLLGLRLQRALHLGAAAMATGALGGMYVRGLLLEYRATWESTFLGPRQVEAWLSFLLGPASFVSGIELPGAAALEQMRSPESGAAATWIHLYAVTTGLMVVAPRLLLALRAGLAARREAAGMRLETEAHYYRRLLAGASGQGVRAEILPYSYSPGPARLDRLKGLLHDVLGARADVRVVPGLEYGSEDLREATGPDVCQVVLFNLAQTPESEVHERFLQELRAPRQDGSVLVLVDAAAWRERNGSPGLEAKLEERRRTWNRVLGPAGIEPVHLDLDHAPTEDLVERIEAALRGAPAARRQVPGKEPTE